VKIFIPRQPCVSHVPVDSDSRHSRRRSKIPSRAEREESAPYSRHPVLLECVQRTGHVLVISCAHREQRSMNPLSHLHRGTTSFRCPPMSVHIPLRTLHTSSDDPVCPDVGGAVCAQVSAVIGRLVRGGWSGTHSRTHHTNGLVPVCVRPCLLT
jgi:hypothetical protein